MAMSGSGISVVVQGPVVGGGVTARVLQSVRHWLPAAEIILSTWRGSEVEGLDFDLLVENEDPGGHVCHRRLPNLYNLNRQIVSSREGLKRASRRYAIKTRTDLLFTGTGFLDYWPRYPSRDQGLRIFRERLINCSVYARNPRRHQPVPFHPGDWFFFGLTEDLLALWDIEPAPEPETSRWFAGRPRPEPDVYPHLLHRYFPEQYLWLSLLTRHGAAIRCHHQWDLDAETLEQTERSFANNLIFLEPEKIGIRSLKHTLSLDDWADIYSHGEWLRLYRRYCEPDLKLSVDPVVIGKDLYHACRLLMPKRLADRLLTRLLGKDGSLLDRWEQRSPRSFKIARAMHKWLG